MQVMHVDLALGCMVSEFVGAAVGGPRLETASCQPNREAVGIVVSAGALVLGVGRPAEFTSPPDDGVFEETPALEILEETCNRLVGGAGVFEVLRHVGMLVPCRVVAVIRIIDLDIAHSRLTQAAGSQAVAAEIVSMFLPDSIHCQGLRAFPG